MYTSKNKQVNYKINYIYIFLISNQETRTPTVKYPYRFGLFRLQE